MALIKCPECNKDISDKSDSCIHCGFPLKNFFNVTCTINGADFDLSEYKQILSASKIKQETIDELGYKLFNNVGTITIYESEELLTIIEKTNIVPKVYNSHHVSALLPTCPRCGSTVITTGARGVNWTLGLIGASKTVNRCGKCGHTWEPKR